MTGTFTVEQLRPIKDGMTISRDAKMGQTTAVTFFSLGKDMDLCQYFEHKKLKGYADFFNSSSSFCCGVI